MKGTVVMDSGSWEVKVGQAGDEGPRFTQRTVVGVCRNRHMESAADDELFVGERALEAADVLEFFDIARQPTRVFEKNWHAALYQKQRALPEQSPLCLVLARALGELEPELVECVFESLDVPSLLWLDAGVAGVLAEGRTSAVVVDVGENAASVVPVFEGLALSDRATTLPLGGRFFRRQFREESGLNLSDLALDSARKAFAADPQLPSCEVKLPDRSTVSLSRAPFDSVAGRVGRDLALLAAATQNSIELPIKAELSSLYLQGGGAVLPGIEEAFEKAGARLKKTHSPAEKRFSAWLGASLYASLEATAPLFISKAFYEENGIEQVLFKNFQ